MSMWLLLYIIMAMNGKIKLHTQPITIRIQSSIVGILMHGLHCHVISSHAATYGKLR